VDWGDDDFSLPTNIGGPVLKAAMQLLRGPDRMEQMRMQLLELQLAKAVTGAATIIRQCEAAEALQVELRQDWAIMGMRGAGKTALAVGLGTVIGNCFAVGWAPELANVYGFVAGTWREAQKHVDGAILLDEIAIAQLPKAELFKALALARQNNVHVIYTAQSSAAVPIDCWRLGPTIAFKRPDSIAAAFERPELVGICAHATQAFASVPKDDKTATLIYREGAYLMTRTGLPDSWNNKTSTLWRRA